MTFTAATREIDVKKPRAKLGPETARSLQRLDQHLRGDTCLRKRHMQATLCRMLSEQDTRRIGAESMCDYRTIRKAYAGKGILISSWTRIALAAERLGLQTPPRPVYRDDDRGQPSPAAISSLNKPQA